MWDYQWWTYEMLQMHHVAAMLHPDANGKRYISAQSESTPFLNIARLLKKHGYDVPTKKSVHL